MEKYAINLCNGWSIENLKNVDKDIKLDEVDFELPFGQNEFYKGEINWIYDPFKVRDEHIEACKEIEAFNKKASFKVLRLKGKEGKWEEIDAFEGTFIEALEYIKKEFTDE